MLRQNKNPSVKFFNSLFKLLKAFPIFNFLHQINFSLTTHIIKFYYLYTPYNILK